MNMLRSGAVYVCLYLFFLLPTYYLPYLGSNSAVFGTIGAAAGGGLLPQTWIHIGLLLAMVLLAWLRGTLTGKTYIAAFPFVAGIFDMMPGLSLIPLVPTVLHILGIFMGVKDKPMDLAALPSEVTGQLTAVFKKRFAISAVAYGVFVVVAVVASMRFSSTLDESVRSLPTRTLIPPSQPGPAPQAAVPAVQAPQTPAPLPQPTSPAPAQPSSAPGSSTAAATSQSGAAPVQLNPQWFGAWVGSDERRLEFSETRLVSSGFRGEPGKKKEPYRGEMSWSQSPEKDGGFGYAEKRWTPASLSREYEKALLAFNRDSTDYSVSEPTSTRRAIQQIAPGTYRVITAVSGGDCDPDYILDKDTLLEIIDCKYAFSISRFVREKASGR